MADSIKVTQSLHDFWDAVLSDGSFTYADIKRRGGPSQPTLSKLQRVGESISADSARRLEDAVGLERGSLREESNGGNARWKPEGAPGEEHLDVRFHDPTTGAYRTLGVVEGYLAAGAWSHTCWKSGASREAYHEFTLASVRLYHEALAGAGVTGTEAHTREYRDAERKQDLALAAQFGFPAPSTTSGDQETAETGSQVTDDDDNPR